jgi:hypothetical protein
MPPRSPHERAGFMLLVDVASTMGVPATDLVGRLFDDGVEIHLPGVDRRLVLRVWRLEPVEDWELRDAMLDFVEGPDGNDEVTPESWEEYEEAAKAGVMSVEHAEEVPSVVLREGDLYSIMQGETVLPVRVGRPGSEDDEELRDASPIAIGDLAVRIEDVPRTTRASTRPTLQFRAQHSQARFIAVLCHGLAPAARDDNERRDAALAVLKTAGVDLDGEAISYALCALTRNAEGTEERDLPAVTASRLVEAILQRRPGLGRPGRKPNVAGLARVLADAQRSAVGGEELSESRLRTLLTEALARSS